MGLTIHTRSGWSLGRYVQVSVETDDAHIDLGLFDKKEGESLATHLREVADELYADPEIATLKQQLAEAQSGNRTLDAEVIELRRLLAFAHGVTYCDDGELQDASAKPFIDYSRDTVDEIKSKIYKRGLAQLTKAEG